MANTLPANIPQHLINYFAGLGTIAAQGSTDDLDMPILKLKKNGDWVYGQEEIYLDDKAYLAVNPLTIKRGYIAFSEAESGIAMTVDGERAEFFYDPSDPPPRIEDLPEVEIETIKGKRGKIEEVEPEYRQQIVLQMVIVGGDDDGLEVLYKPTSVGGLRFCRKIIKEIRKRFDTGLMDIQPLIEVWSEPYPHPKWGELHNPLFEIKEWVDNTIIGENTADEEKPKKLTKKSTQKTRARKDEPEDLDEFDEEEEDKKPKRGRPSRKSSKPTRKKEPEDLDESDEEDDHEEEKPKRGRPSRKSSRSSRKKEPEDLEEPEDLDEPEEEEEEEEKPKRGRGRPTRSRRRNEPVEDDENNEDEAEESTKGRSRRSGRRRR